LSSVIFSLFALTPFLFTFFLSKNEDRLTLASIQGTYGALYLYLMPQYYAYNMLFMFRRLIYAVTLVAMDVTPGLQLYIQVLMSAGVLGYVARVRPYMATEDNIIEMVNESTCLLVFTGLIAKVEGGSCSGKRAIETGWALILIIMLDIALNFLMYLWAILRILYYKCLRRLWHRFCVKAAKSPLKNSDKGSKISGQNINNFEENNDPLPVRIGDI
jgi:hypothetical protein